MSGHWTLLRQPAVVMGSPESLKLLIFLKKKKLLIFLKKPQVNIMIQGEGAGLVIQFSRFKGNPWH